uniref:Uncharacterized protein n=1 Tax=Anopheles atroparvus TaxID=41427 RepID=A0AAG5DLB3_ANOAO
MVAFSYPSSAVKSSKETPFVKVTTDRISLQKMNC